MVTLKQGETLIDHSVLTNGLSGTGWLLQWPESLFLQVLIRRARLQALSHVCVLPHLIFNSWQEWLWFEGLVWLATTLIFLYPLLNLFLAFYVQAGRPDVAWTYWNWLNARSPTALWVRNSGGALCAQAREELTQVLQSTFLLVHLILPKMSLLSFLQPFHLLCLSPGGLVPRREVQVVTGICIQSTAYATSCLSSIRRPHKLIGLTHWPKKSRNSTFTALHPLWKGSQDKLRVCSACCIPAAALENISESSTLPWAPITSRNPVRLQVTYQNRFWLSVINNHSLIFLNFMNSLFWFFFFFDDGFGGGRLLGVFFCCPCKS